MIELDRWELAIVKDICRPYKGVFEVLVFGSRYSGSTHRSSDLDLAVKGDRPLDMMILANFKDAFQDSELPFRVDVVDYRRVSKEFQQIISENSVSLWELP